jgi:hypothetical protein
MNVKDFKSKVSVKNLARIQQIKSIAEQNRTLENIKEELAKSIAG